MRAQAIWRPIGYSRRSPAAPITCMARARWVSAMRAANFLAWAAGSRRAILHRQHGAVGEQARGLDIRLGVGELPAQPLKIRDMPAEGGPLIRIARGEGDRRLGHAAAHGGDIAPRGIDPGHGGLETVAGFAHLADVGHEMIRQPEPTDADGMAAHDLKGRHAGHTLLTRIDEEARYPAPSGGGVGLGI